MECSEDVNMIPSHANENSSEIDLTLNVTEKRTSDLNAGFGTCPSDFTHGFLSGLIGQLDFSQKNLGGACACTACSPACVHVAAPSAASRVSDARRLAQHTRPTHRCVPARAFL
eukprot:scaffold855_cov344-Prasinococcus_capsulatus_cf.AAC.3